MTSPINTPVLFLVFNRLDTTKQVFESIKRAQPPRIYISSDGPRNNVDGENEVVEIVRNYILENIDWDCEVYTLFRDRNLGCKYAVSEAITWFFKNEEQGIVLEDDCLPIESFFWYCENLLNRYKNDESIYLISADSRGPEAISMKEDYCLCKYPTVWGWASWANVWSKYDSEITDWPNMKSSLIKSISKHKSTRRFWIDIFNKMYKKQIDTWDFQLSYLLLKNNGKCIVPRVNQVTNIGFGEGATHTFDENSSSANRTAHNFKFPLSHNINTKNEILVNEYFDKQHFYKQNLILRLKNKLESFIDITYFKK